MAENKIKKLIKKYKDLIPYAVFGVLTTVVNVVSYVIFAHVFNLSVIISTVLAWVVAVSFAYLTNRKWVFFSDAKTRKEVFNEAVSFFYCRLGTGIIDVLIMWFFVERLHFADVWVKIFANVVVIIMNYIASKWLIFKHGNKGHETNKKLVRSISVIAVIGILTILIAEFSPLAPWQTGDSGIDESVFMYVAREMNQGNMPYLDTFDHKGPLLYIIYWLGSLITPWRGVWCLGVLAIFATLLMAYISARKIGLSRGKSLISMLICTTPLCFMYGLQPTGYPQLFALPVIAYSMCVFMDYYRNNYISRLRLVLCGICMGMASMLLMNMVVIWGVLALLAAVYCVKRGDIKKLVGYVLWFLLGVIISVAPILIWLGANGAFQAFVDDYILFNIAYTNSEAGIGANVSVLMDFLKVEIMLIGLVYLVYRFIRKRESFCMANLIVITVTYVVACMAGRFAWHYALIMIPMFFYPLALLVKDCSNNKNLQFVVIGYMLVAIVLPQWIGAGKNMANAYTERNQNHAALTTKAVTEVVLNNTDEDDEITAIGNNVVLYLRSNRMSASKYSFQHPLIYIDDNIKNEYLDDLRKNLPELVIIEMKAFPEEKGEAFMNEVMDFLKEEKYTKIWETPDEPDYNIWPYAIYKHE